jgi:hypothetical protein
LNEVICQELGLVLGNGHNGVGLSDVGFLDDLGVVCPDGVEQHLVESWNPLKGIFVPGEDQGTGVGGDRTSVTPNGLEVGLEFDTLPGVELHGSVLHYLDVGGETREGADVDGR